VQGLNAATHLEFCSLRNLCSRSLVVLRFLTAVSARQHITMRCPMLGENGHYGCGMSSSFRTSCSISTEFSTSFTPAQSHSQRQVMRRFGPSCSGRNSKLRAGCELLPLLVGCPRCFPVPTLATWHELAQVISKVHIRSLFSTQHVVLAVAGRAKTGRTKKSDKMKIATRHSPPHPVIGFG
jgi:hypothetical protein